jgi:hypothetical protein
MRHPIFRAKFATDNAAKRALIDEIAEVLFNQRQTAHDFEAAKHADPESDAGTLLSITRDDAGAVLQLLMELDR